MRTLKHALVRAAAAVTTTGLAVSGLMVVTASPSSAELTETNYGFQGTAYGTRVLSKGSGIESGRSAFSWIACTRLLGRVSNNFVSEVDLPPDASSIAVDGVESDNATYRRKAQGIDAAISSTNSVANTALGGGSAPLLKLQGLRSTSTAWATSNGRLHAENEVTTSGISLTGIADPGDSSPLGDLFDALNGGIDQVLQALVDNGGAIEIPGLGLVSIGYDRHSEHKNFAVAASFVLRVQLYGTDGLDGGGDDTLVGIGHSRARINRDLPAAVMAGVAYGSDAELGDGIVKLGKLGEQPLPCRGSGGKVLSSPTFALHFPGVDQLVASGVQGRVAGDQFDSGKAYAWAEGSVNRLTLGPLEIRGIVGRVNVKQNAAGNLSRQDIDGSSLGKILVDGESQGSFDPSTADQIPEMEIPGVAHIDYFVKEKTKRGMKVSAVVITFADDSAGVSTIRLGNASALIKRR